MSKKITERRLENIALFYLQRYESCAFKLTEMLKRRLLKCKIGNVDIPEDAMLWIQNVVSKMQDLGYIDDKRYCENTIRRLQNSGKSIRFICAKLRQDGIESELIENILQGLSVSNNDMDIISARRLVDRKKIGYHRLKEDQNLFYQKDLATLARAGFSYEIAKKALAPPQD